jgi:hypothetical protein
MDKELYIYGSNHQKDHGKCHIADSTGKPICGAKILWGECTGVVTDIQGDDLITIPFGCRSGPGGVLPSKTFAWDFYKCKKCEIKLKKILNKS